MPSNQSQKQFSNEQAIRLVVKECNAIFLDDKEINKLYVSIRKTVELTLKIILAVQVSPLNVNAFRFSTLIEVIKGQPSFDQSFIPFLYKSKRMGNIDAHEDIDYVFDTDFRQDLYSYLYYFFPKYTTTDLPAIASKWIFREKIFSKLRSLKEPPLELFDSDTLEKLWEVWSVVPGFLSVTDQQVRFQWRFSIGIIDFKEQVFYQKKWYENELRINFTNLIADSLLEHLDKCNSSSDIELMKEDWIIMFFLRQSHFSEFSLRVKNSSKVEQKVFSFQFTLKLNTLQRDALYNLVIALVSKIARVDKRKIGDVRKSDSLVDLKSNEFVVAIHIADLLEYEKAYKI